MIGSLFCSRKKKLKLYTAVIMKVSHICLKPVLPNCALDAKILFFYCSRALRQYLSSFSLIFLTSPSPLVATHQHLMMVEIPQLKPPPPPPPTPSFTHMFPLAIILQFHLTLSEFLNEERLSSHLPFFPLSIANWFYPHHSSKSLPNF